MPVVFPDAIQKQVYLEIGGNGRFQNISLQKEQVGLIHQIVFNRANYLTAEEIQLTKWAK
jgi:hypothetical protein